MAGQTRRPEYEGVDGRTIGHLARAHLAMAAAWAGRSGLRAGDSADRSGHLAADLAGRLRCLSLNSGAQR